MHHKNYLLVGMLLLLVNFIVGCGGDDGGGNSSDYSRYSGTWNINTVRTGASNDTITCEIESPAPATVSREGNATFGPINNDCGTVMRGSFSGNTLTMTSNNDKWRNNGIICCTGTLTVTITFSNANRGTGKATLNNCPDQESLWCTVDVTMTK
jgi:hypothetical protein